MSTELIRKSRSSCVALFTTGALLSATFGATLGCTSTSMPSDQTDGAIGARADILTGYLSSAGDSSYQVDAPDVTAQGFGVAKYDVKIVNNAVRIGGLGAGGDELAAVELTPATDGIHLVTHEGGEVHNYVFSVTGTFADQDFVLRMTYDGAAFSTGYNATRQIVSLGDMSKAPAAASPLIQQIWRDIVSPDVQNGMGQSVSQCFACFLCGAASVAFAAAIAGILWVGWPVIGAFLAALLGSGGTAAAAAVLTAAGVSATAITFVLGALGALGFGVLKYCYKCATGMDFITGPGSGSGSGSGSDTGSCPANTETTPTMASLWSTGLTN